MLNGKKDFVEKCVNVSQSAKTEVLYQLRPRNKQEVKMSGTELTEHHQRKAQ